MKAINFVISVFLFAVLFAGALPAFAEESLDTPTFPIVELGNCSSVSECKAYCDDPVHNQACISYAESKGFYKKEEIESKKEELLSQAKSELGCLTKEECAAFCSESENIEKCSLFAKKYSLPGGKNQANTKSSLLSKAKSVLNCSSVNSCKEVCEMTENKEKCAAFAKDNGLSGGSKKVGPGGCTSEETCGVYCENDENEAECATYGFMKKKVIVGPGGCNSASACKEYCLEHPEECESFVREKEEKKMANEENEIMTEEEDEDKKETPIEEKKSIFQILQFKKQSDESYKKEQQAKSKKTTVTKTRKETSTTPKPTRKPSPGYRKQTPNSLLEQQNSDKYYDEKVEYCIKRGCIWKETYCNCSYLNYSSSSSEESGESEEVEPTVIKTPTPIPVTSGAGSNLNSELQSGSGEVEYDYNQTQNYTETEEEYLETQDSSSGTTGTSTHAVQGAYTGWGFFDFVKGLFR